MSDIEVYIVSAEKELFSGKANAVFASAENGDVGIFPQHAPFLSTLKPGQVRICVDGHPDEYFFVSGGIIEVQPSIVTILSDTAARGEDLDETKAEEAKQRAQAELESKLSAEESALAMARFAEASAQLRLISELRKKIK